jgi:hypothetical protein
MQNQRLVCCPFCSKKLTRNWEESHCGIPYNEYQTCVDHHTVSFYSWPAFIKSVDVRTIDVIKMYPNLINFEMYYYSLKEKCHS